MQFDTVCEKSSTMMQFTPPEIWKQHAVLFGTHTGCQSEDSDVDSKSVRGV